MQEIVQRCFGGMNATLDAQALFGERFGGRSVPNELSAYLEAGRCGLASVTGYLDPIALSYLTGYARWFFAPSFMLRALQKGSLAGDSEQFVNVFRFCPDILLAHGLDEDADLASIPAEVRADLDVRRTVSKMDIEACLAPARPSAHPSTFEYFCQSACHFSACERKVVAMFLVWVLERNPYDVGAYLAIDCFWRD